MPKVVKKAVTKSAPKKVAPRLAVVTEKPAIISTPKPKNNGVQRIKRRRQTFRAR